MSGPRVPPLAPEQWSPEAREVLEPLRGAMGGRALNIFGTLAHHPELLRRWLVFANHVLAPLVLGARQVGIDDAEIARVAAGPDAPGWAPREAAVLRAADELWREARVGDATWAELSRHFDVPQLLDLVFAIGQYTLVSMALNTLGVERDPGVPGFEETAGSRP